MTNIPLRDVVAFLRQHNALGVLDGAPYVEPTGACPLDLRAVQAVEDATADALLYLGTSEICPAAEGWAARVLALTRESSAPVLIQDDRSFLCIWQVPLTNTEPYALWQWVDHDCGDDGQWVRINGTPPPTPAERLAAVLRYEMERSR